MTDEMPQETWTWIGAQLGSVCNGVKPDFLVEGFPITERFEL